MKMARLIVAEKNARQKINKREAKNESRQIHANGRICPSDKQCWEKTECLRNMKRESLYWHLIEIN